MKNILVPTDFSKNAECAFNYALALAEQINATITVAHIYHSTVNHMNEYMTIADNEMEKISRERLDYFAKKRDSKTQNKVAITDQVEQKLEFGFAAEKLVKMSKTGEYDLIVMGATGSTGMLEMVFGKVSLHVAKSSGCPVLLIPSGVHFEPVREIMYAIEYEMVNEYALHQLEEVSKKLNANVHLIHVYENLEKKPDGTQSSLVEKTFQQKVPNLKFTMDAISSDSVVHGLSEYATEKKMDWMVLVKPQRKLWQRLLHKSKTNEIIMDPQMPLMIIH